MERLLQNTVKPVDRYPINLGVLVPAFVIGALVGAVGWLFNLLIVNYFVDPVFCNNPDSVGACMNGGTIAWVLAHLLVVAASIVAMVRFAIYRPLLVAIAVIAAVWGINGWLGGLNWWSATLWQALVFGLGYAAFAWVARITQFWFAVVAMVIIVVIARLVLASA